MFVATGSPVQPFVDAVKAALVRDAALMAIVTAVTGHVSETTELAFPYIVLGRRTRGSDTGAFGIAGAVVTLELDWWSAHRGPFEAQTIGGHLLRILLHQPLIISGFDLVQGSVTCEFEEVFEEPDNDMPGQKLYHGVQRWTAEIHELR